VIEYYNIQKNANLVPLLRGGACAGVDKLSTSLAKASTPQEENLKRKPCNQMEKKSQYWIQIIRKENNKNKQ
jgi:hypothetical protein